MSDGPVQRSGREPVSPSVDAERPRTRTEQSEVPAGAVIERVSREDSASLSLPSQAPSVQVAPPARAQKSPLLGHVENILEEDLLELYRELSPRQRNQFKREGERTARTIERLLKKTTTTIMEIIRLIRRWLRLLPGANIFFIEKEATIKAERIMSLKK